MLDFAMNIDMLVSLAVNGTREHPEAAFEDASNANAVARMLTAEIVRAQVERQGNSDNVNRLPGSWLSLGYTMSDAEAVATLTRVVNDLIWSRLNAAGVPISPTLVEWLSTAARSLASANSDINVCGQTIKYPEWKSHADRNAKRNIEAISDWDEHNLKLAIARRDADAEAEAAEQQRMLRFAIHLTDNSDYPAPTIEELAASLTGTPFDYLSTRGRGYGVEKSCYVSGISIQLGHSRQWHAETRPWGEPINMIWHLLINTGRANEYRAWAYGTHEEAEAEFTRLETAMNSRAVTEWVLNTGVLPEGFRAEWIATQDPSVVAVAADYHKDQGSEEMWYMCQAVYARLLGKCNVEVQLNKTTHIVLNPHHETPKRKYDPSRIIGPVDYAVVEVGKSIRLVRHAPSTEKVTENTFAIDDYAEHGSYNLVYYGPVVSISKKQVVIADRYRSYDDKVKKYKFSIGSFFSRNIDFDFEKAAQRNASWSD